MLDVMEAVEPCPTEIMAITEPIPMTMPRIVSPERALFESKAEDVSRNKSEIIIKVYGKDYD